MPGRLSHKCFQLEHSQLGKHPDPLRVSLPSIEITSSRSHRSVLILAGSSAVGAAAIQLIRLALSTTTIVTTSTPKHHSHSISLGATRSFDRGDISSVKAATLNSEGFDAILDTVGAAASEPSVFNLLDGAAPKTYSQVQTGQNAEPPAGVDATTVRARQLFEVPGGKGAVAILAALLEKRMYELPVKVEAVEQGLTSIQQGVEKLRAGVSGVKLVVTL